MQDQQVTPEGQEFGALSLVLLLYSIIFLCALFYGWHRLIQGSLPAFAAGLLAAVLAVLAWGIAKIVGSSERGILGNVPLFLFLLMLSAVGVFNTLMIQLEGRSIFLEVIDRASAQYSQLHEHAKSKAANEEVDSLRARVESLKTKLAQEIDNPRNCGDGPEANEILNEIAQLLPGFRRYSGNTRDCSQNEQLIQMYHQQMDKLMNASSTFVRNNVEGTSRYLTKLSLEIPQRIAALAQLRKELNEGSTLNSTKLKLDEFAADYQAMALELRSTIPGIGETIDFQAQLDIKEARELGEWGHLIPLFMERIDRIPTWIYLLTALFMDWLLVHMFARIAEHRRRMPRKRPVPGGLNRGSI
jgi:hypothetical protein